MAVLLARFDVDVRARRCVLGVVLDQVVEQLFEQHRIGADQGRCSIEARAHVVAFESPGEAMQCRTDHFLDRDPLGARPMMLGFDARHVEHVADQLRELRGFVDD